MKGTTFNQLAVFHAIAREGSISAAAKQLQVAPPSVSNALKALEQQLGLPLFTRTTRRVELTEAGRLLFARSADSLAQLELAVESIGDLAKVPSGKLRITLPRFVYQYLLRPIYADFCQQYPEIELEISIDDATVDIIESGFDLGIRFGSKVRQGMVAKALTAASRDALFVSPSYAERYGVPSNLSQLQQHRLIQYRFISSKQLVPLELLEAGQQVKIDMPLGLIVNDTDLMVDAALKGLGIGRMIEPMVAEQLASGELIPVMEPYWQTMPGMYLYFAQHTQKAKRVRVLIDFLMAYNRL